MFKFIFIYLTCSITLLSCCDTPTKTQEQEPEFRLLWSFNVTDEPGNSISRVPAAILDEQIIIRPYGRIISLSKNSELDWRYQLSDVDQKNSQNDLLIDEESIFGKENLSNEYYSLDIKSGEEVWRSSTSDTISFIESNGDAIDENFIYLSGNEKTIYKFDKKKGGEILQKYFIGKAPRQLLSYKDMLIISIGSFDGSTSNSGEIKAINKQSGDVVWNYHTDKGGFFTAPLIEKNGIIYSGTEFSSENTFVALDVKTGEVLWENHDFLTSHFVLSNDTLFINPAGGVIAVEASTGKEIWRYDIGSASESNIEYLNGFVYLPNGSQLLIIDARTGRVAHTFYSSDETVIWSLKSEEANNRIYLQTSFNLYAYEGWMKDE